MNVAEAGAEGGEVSSTLDTLIGIVSDRLSDLRGRLQGTDGLDEEASEYYRARLGLAFLLGLRDRQAR